MPNKPAEDLDLSLAGRSSMGQDPILVRPDAAGEIDAVAISRPYGRLGNNVYQLLNAAMVARGLGLTRLLVPDGLAGCLTAVETIIGDLTLEPLARRQATGCLHGSFFVPFGCETAALRVDDVTMEGVARELGDALFPDVLSAADVDPSPTIAVAFRGGDVFRVSNSIPAAYVQPPAAFYLRAIAHARRTEPDSLVELVSVDRANPALAVVEDALHAAGVRFRSSRAGVRVDLARLCACRTLVSCPSTFVEAAAMMSRRLRRLYSFREHASQSEFRPFAQWRFPEVLRQRGVQGFLLDDASRTFTNKWQWTAATAQIDAIRSFDGDHLRLYPAL